MGMVELNRHPGRKELQRFSAIWLPAFLAALGVVLFRRSHALPISLILWLAALLSIGAGLIAPGLTRPVYLALNIVALPFGWVISHAILLFVYFLVITPIGLMLRLLGRDSLGSSFDRTAKSYWHPRKPSGALDRRFRQF